jgi:ATP-dependent DNA helicase RecQ
MLLPGVTLVVSPLIALMKDQVESAPPAVREAVTLINSDIDADERYRRLDRVRSGQIKLLYVAPERLLDPTLRAALSAAGLARVVIDEAHCISLWGHDFRPDYLMIPTALRDLGEPPVLAVTATATPEMAEQIGIALGRPLELVRTSVFRENLFYEVVNVGNREERIEKLIEICQHEHGTGIIYVSSRKDTEAHAQTLRNRGIQAQSYHAGMPREQRANVQERFMRGELRIIVATVAFGMGVDKSNVRFIVHMMPPGTIESYAQESGRAGRDGSRARCILLTASSDRTTLRSRARRDLVSIELLRQAYLEVRRANRAGWSAVDFESLRRVLNPDPDARDETDPKTALGYLQQAKLIARTPDAPVRYRLVKRRTAGVPFEEGDEAERQWQALMPLLGDRWQAGESVELDTATACSTLQIEPAELDALLGDRYDVSVNRDRRTTWFRILPAAADSTQLLERLLARAKRQADERIDQIMTYIEGHQCRHVLLAAALGERIRPCGDACDVCDPSHARVKQTSAPKASRAKRTATAEDALIVLKTIPDLPFALGKPGMTKLLGGSPESSVRADRSKSFGALQDLGASRIGRLIDQLVEAELLEFWMNGEYKMLALTGRGAGATRKDLELMPAFAAPAISLQEGEVLNPDESGLYDRLVAWRSAEAQEQRLPAYVVAHNTMLRAMARSKPTSLAQLGGIPGFGKQRTDRYGEAILAIIRNES